MNFPFRGRKSRHEGGPLYFRIGEISVSLRSELDEVLEDFASLYQPFRRERVDERECIRMEVGEGKRTFRGGRRYVIRGDGEEIGKARRHNEVLPYLEWGINWRVIARREEYLQLHAASLVRDGCAVVFAGTSGSGKSTLAAGLLSRGWKYLSDEFALIDRRTLLAHPFPKALCIKFGAFGVVERLNLSLWRHRYYIKTFKGRVGYIPPHEAAAQPVAEPAPVRFVFFPKYIEGSPPRHYPVSRAHAAFLLARSTMNGKALGNRKTAILADLVRNTQCFGLESGPIEDTCDLIESLVAEPAVDASNVVSANGESGTEKGISVQLRLTSDDRQRVMRLERATSGLEGRCSTIEPRPRRA